LFAAFAFSLLAFGLCATTSAVCDRATAQTSLPGYAQAEDSFMRMTLDQRVKTQVLLTAAGYWPAVPDPDFSTRLFNAILQFEVSNGFVPLGVLNAEQMEAYENRWALPECLEVRTRQASNDEQPNMGTDRFATCRRVNPIWVEIC
jgi:hypothetical protein